MKAFFSEDQLLHQPQQFMRLGRIAKPTDLPSRAHALRGALAQRGIALDVPKDYGRAPAETVHSVQYLDYLQSAYSRWRALDVPGVEPGIEVLPNLAPYHSGVAGMERPPCPSPSVVAQTGWYIGDLACPIGPDTWTSVLRSSHAAVAAADAVLGGDDFAYALCRPSGHHAHRDRANGFCYLNNSATAAQRLRSRHARVGVLDVDAHHGDGTQHIFYARPDVLTVSVHADPSGYFPFYTGYAIERGVNEGEGCNLNLPVAHGDTGAGFLRAVEQGAFAVAEFAPQALVLALGFDSYKDDPISVLRLELDAYRHIGQQVGALKLPTVVVQEGGYHVDAIGPALDAFLRGLTQAR